MTVLTHMKDLAFWEAEGQVLVGTTECDIQAPEVRNQLKLMTERQQETLYFFYYKCAIPESV